MNYFIKLIVVIVWTWLILEMSFKHTVYKCFVLLVCDNKYHVVFLLNLQIFGQSILLLWPTTTVWKVRIFSEHLLPDKKQKLKTVNLNKSLSFTFFQIDFEFLNVLLIISASLFIHFLKACLLWHLAVVASIRIVI